MGNVEYKKGPSNPSISTDHVDRVGAFLRKTREHRTKHEMRTILSDHYV